MGFKIAIVGAGPAGCMHARSFLAHHSSDINVTIFESESSIDFRSQGGTLDLHVKTGQRALREAGLYDEFLKFVRFDGESISLANKNLVRYVKMSGNAKGSTTGRPEIDRPKLRQILYESLPQGTVRWNHKVTSVESGTLHFLDQPSQNGFHLIVGADGGWSKERNYVSATKPYYSGISGHAFRIPDAERTTPDLYDLVNRGSLFSWSDGQSIMAQFMGDGSINVATWALRPSTWQKDCGYDVNDARATKEACLRDFADWDARLVSFTQRAENHVVPRDLYMLTVGFSWGHIEGVTLMSDAAHLMTPFAGEGVNFAFEDCLELADAITRSTSIEELESLARTFELSMFRRAKKTTQQTLDTKDAMFIPGSPAIEKFILCAAEDELGWWLTKLVTPLIYLYYFVFRLIHMCGGISV